MKHGHPCPECHEHVLCDHLGCTIEPDLYDDVGRYESGSFVVCDPCQTRLLFAKDAEAVRREERRISSVEDLERTKDIPATIVHVRSGDVGMYIPATVVSIGDETRFLNSHVRVRDEVSGLFSKWWWMSWESRWVSASWEHDHHLIIGRRLNVGD